MGLAAGYLAVLYYFVDGVVNEGDGTVVVYQTRQTIFFSKADMINNVIVTSTKINEA